MRIIQEALQVVNVVRAVVHLDQIDRLWGGLRCGRFMFNLREIE